MTAHRPPSGGVEVVVCSGRTRFVRRDGWRASFWSSLRRGSPTGTSRCWYGAERRTGAWSTPFHVRHPGPTGGQNGTVRTGGGDGARSYLRLAG
jgi:hypothetical protein